MPVCSGAGAGVDAGAGAGVPLPLPLPLPVTEPMPMPPLLLPLPLPLPLPVPEPPPRREAEEACPATGEAEGQWTSRATDPPPCPVTPTYTSIHLPHTCIHSFCWALITPPEAAIHT